MRRKAAGTGRMDSLLRPKLYIISIKMVTGERDTDLSKNIRVQPFTRGRLHDIDAF